MPEHRLVMSNLKPKLSEANLKHAVTDYLTYKQNQGKLLFLRLNTGSFILTDKEGNFRRRVQGAKKGTADFIVIRSGGKSSGYILRLVDFLELKSAKGKQTKEQKTFQEMVEAQGCGYHIIRSYEELQEIIL